MYVEYTIFFYHALILHHLSSHLSKTNGINKLHASVEVCSSFSFSFYISKKYFMILYATILKIFACNFLDRPRLYYTSQASVGVFYSHAPLEGIYNAIIDHGGYEIISKLK